MWTDRLLARPDWAPSWVPSIEDDRAVGWLRRAALLVLFVGVAACIGSGADSPPDPVLGAPSDDAGADGAADGDSSGPTGSAELAGTVCAPDADPSRFVDETGTLVETFGTVAVEVDPDGDGDGDPLELCVLHASSGEQRSRGLMEVTEFDGFDGMLFSYDGDTDGAYYMFNTPTPLSIYWFTAAGDLVRTVDMEPCLDTPAEDCPRYPAGGTFRYALEVPTGDLRDAGIGDAPTLTVTNS